MTDSHSLISPPLEAPEDFPRLPALAERLGVAEGEGDGRFWVMMADGRRYDLFSLVNALLDRLDAVEANADRKE